MKAKIKATGEIINIADYARVVLNQCDSRGNPIELGFDEVEILQEDTSDIDWEQRRYKIAKEVFASIYDFTIDRINFAKYAVDAADTLIAELKKGGNNEKH